MFRTEVVTVRLDPRLRYLAELAARKQRRTLSSFIEWVIEDSLNRVIVSQYNDDEHFCTIANEADQLWDVDEADRFALLAFAHQELLTHEEQVLWKLIRENGFLWAGSYDNDDVFTWPVTWQNLDLERLRKHWCDFNDVAKGIAEKDILPLW